MTASAEALRAVQEEVTELLSNVQAVKGRPFSRMVEFLVMCKQLAEIQGDFICEAMKPGASSLIMALNAATVIDATTSLLSSMVDITQGGLLEGDPVALREAIGLAKQITTKLDLTARKRAAGRDAE